MIPPFKKAKYHPSNPGGIYVHSPDEEDALGPEWVDTPALLPKVEDPAPAQPAPEGGDQSPKPEEDPWTTKKRGRK